MFIVALKIMNKFNSILYYSDNNTHNRNETEDEKITTSPYRSKFIAFQAKYMLIQLHKQ